MSKTFKVKASPVFNTKNNLQIAIYTVLLYSITSRERIKMKTGKIDCAIAVSCDCNSRRWESVPRRVKSCATLSGNTLVLVFKWNTDSPYLNGRK